MNQKDKPPVKVDRNGYMKCRVCGCTEIQPCEPPCSWRASGTRRVSKGNIVVELDDLCTTCHSAAAAVASWLEEAHRPSKPALMREAVRILETE